MRNRQPSQSLVDSRVRGGVRRPEAGVFAPTPRQKLLGVELMPGGVHHAPPASARYLLPHHCTELFQNTFW